MAYTQDDLKGTLKKLLSSDIKRESGQSNEEFIARLKARALPIINDIGGVLFSDFSGDVNDEMKSTLTKELLNKLSNETGIAIKFSEDLPDYNNIKNAFLEVLSDLKAKEILNK
jgi:hypothetical protein